VHRGQGTRNRRLLWSAHFLELLWVRDAVEARAGALRLDRRADWAATGASPFGVGFRGRLDDTSRKEFWLYDALGPRIWIHRDNEQAPERPLVFVLELERRAELPRGEAGARRQPGDLRELRVHGPVAPSLPEFVGPTIAHVQGAHLLELIVGDGRSARRISDLLVLRS